MNNTEEFQNLIHFILIENFNHKQIKILFYYKYLNIILLKLKF